MDVLNFRNYCNGIEGSSDVLTYSRNRLCNDLFLIKQTTWRKFVGSCQVLKGENVLLLGERICGKWENVLEVTAYWFEYFLMAENLAQFENSWLTAQSVSFAYTIVRINFRTSIYRFLNETYSRSFSSVSHHTLRSRSCNLTSQMSNVFVIVVLGSK